MLSHVIYIIRVFASKIKLLFLLEMSMNTPKHLEGTWPPFLETFCFETEICERPFATQVPEYIFFFWPVVFKYITCEQQTYFRSSLPSPSEKCILFYFSGGEKWQPEIHLLFGVTSQNANISMSLVRVSNLSALFCCGINWIYVVGNLGEKVANRGTALSWSYPMLMLLHFC